MNKEHKISNDIKEDYCSFEVSKLLNEKGFKWEYKDVEPDEYGDGKHSYFERRSNKDKVLISHFYADFNQNIQQYNALHIAAPTHALAIKWIRENFQLSIEISTNAMAYSAAVVKQMYVHSYYEDNFKSPEAATEAALLYTLQNLIP